MDEFNWQLEASHPDGLLSLVSLICGGILLCFAILLFLRSQRTLGIFALAGVIFSVFALPVLRRWLPAGLCVQVLWMMGVFYYQCYAQVRRQKWIVLWALRCAAVLVIFSALYKPAFISVTNRSAEKPALAVLVDRSASMSITDDGAPSDRFNQSLGRLDEISGRLGNYFDLQWYHFARTPWHVEQFAALSKLSATGPDAQQTNLADAIIKLRSDFDNARLAGALVVSDGNYDKPADTSAAGRELRSPLFCVGVGSEQQKNFTDLSVESVQAPFQAPLHSTTPITIKISASGLAGQHGEIELLDTQTNKVLQTKTIKFDDSASQLVKLQYTPPADLTQQVPVTQRLAINTRTLTGETNLLNNSADLHIRVINPQLRVLYIEGAMRPEYKFLKRSLEADQNIQFASLIRWSGNRFSSYGRLDGKKLVSLPTSDEDFGLFDVLILGDIDRTFLQYGWPGRLERIKKFVSDGGGLLMIGGLRSFGPGGYADTPIEEALGINAGPRTIGQENESFKPKLTAEGQRHPIFEGISQFFATPDSAPQVDIPDLQGCVVIQDAKQPTQVLMVHPTRSNASGPLAVLVVNPVFAKGRSAGFACDTTWRWHMQPQKNSAHTLYPKFWGQLVRWLGRIATRDESQKPYVIARASKKHIRSQQSLEITAKANREDIALAAKLKDAKGSAVRHIPLTPAQAGRGWREKITIDVEGNYNLEVLAIENSSQKVLAKDDIEIIVSTSSKELQQTARNDSALKYLADMTDGQYARLENIDSLVGGLVKLAAGLPESQITISRYPLYNFPLGLLLVVGFVTVEWILRRRWMLS